jgi:dienelactone hydrolase
MAGSSAGAITSLLVDWRREDPGTSGNPGFSSVIRAAASISGGTPNNDDITDEDGSVIFFHGTEDQTVPYAWAVSNYQAMRNHGIPSVFESFQGAGHGLEQAGYRDVIYQQTDYFLYSRLDLAHAAR